MNFEKHRLADPEMVDLYKSLVTPRMIEEKMLILLRQGKISKWFSGIGQEAVAVGVTRALRPTDFILPLHRNLGVFTTRHVPFSRLFAQWQGKISGFTKGRDRSFHFGTIPHHIVGMISHLGAMAGVADGLGLSAKLKNEGGVVVTFSGEGGTSEGDFHEALNVAAVWKLPVLFVVENNGYGLSTPSAEQFACKDIADKGRGYGIKSKIIDGNNILEVYKSVSKIVKSMRKNPQPFLLECKTFRMRGHEEASGTKYVPQDLLDHWSEKDPLANYEKFLMKHGLLSEMEIIDIKRSISEGIERDLEDVFSEPDVDADLDHETTDIYAPHQHEEVFAEGNKKEMRLVDAISDGLRLALEKHDELIVMGQDIAEYGGVFKITEGFVDQFGKDRIRNTPICESAILGAGLGLSIGGNKAVVEMQFADFVSCGFNQIVNNLAKTHYRWGHPVNVTVRMPTGAGVNAGPFHSQSNEAWFFHTPGLKIVYPSSPAEAKGLLISSIEDPNPVLFFEHKKLYRSIREDVSTDYYNLPLGKAHIAQEGNEITVVTYGWGVHWAKELAEKNSWSLEVVDLRTLLPWDKETVVESIRKTGKCLVLHEDTITGGIGAEISAWITEHCFEMLDAPIYRVGSLDTPVPMAKALEEQFLASHRLEEKLEKLLNY